MESNTVCTRKNMSTIFLTVISHLDELVEALRKMHVALESLLFEDDENCLHILLEVSTCA